MSFRGFILDLNRCVGCKACQIACKDRKHLPAGIFFRRADTIFISGRFRTLSAGCNHCKNPACLAACPNGAWSVTPEGAVLHDDSKCIGCGLCVASCPFGSVVVNPVTGRAAKCDLCGGDPACVRACPPRALSFGELKDREEQPVFMPDFHLTDPQVRYVNLSPDMAVGRENDD